MKQAVKGASKWLIEHTKRNLIPYKLFKSILDKQIEWAKNNRGVTLDFSELSEAVKTELLKAGIYTMSPDGKQPEHTSASNFAAGEEAHRAIHALTLSLKGDKPILPVFGEFFRWYYVVFDKSTAEGFTELRFSVNASREAGHA